MTCEVFFYRKDRVERGDAKAVGQVNERAMSEEGGVWLVFQL